MASIRETLGFGKKTDGNDAQAGDAPGGVQDGPKWKVTLTGPVKGLAPVSITVQAATGKAACAGLKSLFLHGKLKVERA